MLRDNLVGLIEPMRISAGVDPLALSTQTQASDDRSSCLENPRPEGAESSLTENVASPFQAEPAQDENKPELVNIKGTVKAEGDKIIFVSDETGKSWDVVNPETLKEHVGHHVELSAHVYKDKGQIHLMTITMLKQ